MGVQATSTCALGGLLPRVVGTWTSSTEAWDTGRVAIDTPSGEEVTSLRALRVLCARSLVAVALLFTSPVNAEPGSSWIALGDEGADGWVVSDVLEHPEFVRIEFRRAGERTSVEVTATAEPSGQALVQPGPGSQPPAVLVSWVRTRWESRPVEVEVAPVTPNWEPGGTVERAPPPLHRIFGILGLICLLTLFHSRKRLTRPTWREVAISVFAFAATLAAFSVFAGELALFRDPIRDIGLARDCNAGLCGSGARAGFASLSQGTLWPRLVGALIAVGVPLESFPLSVNVLHAITVACIAFVVVRETGSPLVSGLLSAAAVALLFRCDAAGYFWNPTLVPIASVAAAVALRGALRSGRWPDYAFAGVALWIVAEAHVIGFVLVPVLLVVAVARAENPIRSALAVLLIPSVLFALVSPNAAQINADAAGGLGVLVPVAAIAVGLAARRFGPGMADKRTLLGVGLIFVVAVVASAVLFGEPRWRYLGPGLGFVLFGIADAGRVGIAKGAVVAAFSLAVSIPLIGASSGPSLSTAHADLLRTLGVRASYSELLWTLHSDVELGVPMAVDATFPLRDEGADHGAVSVVWLEIRPEGEGWEWFGSGDGGFALRGYAPWVVRPGVRACESTGECQRYLPDERSVASRYTHRSPRLSPPNVRPLNPSRFVFPIEVPEPHLGQTRELLLLPTRGDCHVEILDVTGLAYRGTLPATRVTLEAVERSGELVVAVHGECGETYQGTAPTWIEAPTIPPQIETAFAPARRPPER